MPGYHSKIKEPSECFGGNIAFLTFRTKYRGPVLTLLEEHLSIEPVKQIPTSKVPTSETPNQDSEKQNSEKQNSEKQNSEKQDSEKQNSGKLLSDKNLSERKDIIEESFYYFKPNVFLKSYDIQSSCDRILIYVTLYIIECLKAIKSVRTRDEAAQILYALAISRFDIPGDPGFPLNHVYGKPKSAEECDLLRQYLVQLRCETGKRLLDKVFLPGTNQINKWWMCFNKRKFMNISLS